MSVYNPDATLGRSLNSVYVLSDAETRDARVVVPIRVSLVFLSIVFDLKGLDWREFLLRCMQRQQVPILDRNGEEIEIDPRWLEYQEIVADNGNLPPEGAEDPAVERRVATFDGNLRSYFNDTCRRVFDADGRAVIHEVNRHKFVDIAAIVSASHPEFSAYWPRHPVNGNKPPEAANDNVRDWLRYRC